MKRDEANFINGATVRFNEGEVKKTEDKRCRIRPQQTPRRLVAQCDKAFVFHRCDVGPSFSAGF
jgi:hypothetical protein